MASSSLISRAAWHTDEKHQHQHQAQDLEDAQSPDEGEHHGTLHGNRADLTEVAAPAPVPKIETGDDLERQQTRASTTTDKRSSLQQHDEQLAEVAVPSPISHSTSRPATPTNGEDIATEEKAEDDIKPPHSKSSPSELATISWLIFFSFWGTLARLGVEAITTYPNAIIPSPVLWANLGGSMFLGFLLEDRRLFQATASELDESAKEDEITSHIHKTKKTLPLYIGLATGFCGSFTSFSTYITDAFLALSNGLAPANPTSPYHTIAAQDITSRNGGYSFEAVAAVLILHPAVSIGALKTGAHLAVGLERVIPNLPTDFVQRCLDRLVVVLGFGCWLGAVLLSIWPVGPDWRRRATMSLVFSPPGCLLRFYLGKFLNARVPSFPLGTFAANIFGTCIEGMAYDLQHSASIIGNVASGNANSCAVLEGVMQGFCGCTTTVSTWVAELNGLRRRHAWFYGIVTVGVALAFQVVIMGSVAWTVGFHSRCSA